MSVIHVLDEHLTNMIAAGEVVERPANIVKECVENAIDAGALHISIEADDGGIERLVITDDGCGMDFEDARLAFERHATSKLTCEEDLFNISTMGFRGEALASIAAVAKVDLMTNNTRETTHIAFEYGKCLVHEQAQAPRGTRIEITGLFVKTPARFKYLRKPAYELSVISDLVNKLAVSHPEIAFTLSSNNKTIFSTSGSGSVKEVIYQMYGSEVARNAVSFESQSDDFSISGYAIQPKISRATKYFIFISINSRLIRSSQIQNAIIDAYREFLPPNRYPIVLLNIETDPQLVDVNVHPNKWEVRLSKQEDLARLIMNSIQELFKKELETVEIKKEKPVKKIQQESLFNSVEEKPEPADFAALFNPNSSNESGRQNFIRPQNDGAARDNKAAKTGQTFHPGPAFNVQETRPKSDHSDDFQIKNSGLFNQTFVGKEENKEDQKEIKKETAAVLSSKQEVSYPIPVTRKGKKFFENLKIIGQLKDSYILCENENGLVVIDQHAAQERSRFEKIQKSFARPCTRLQPLMLPILIKAAQSVLERLEDINQKSDYFGIHFESFGTGEIIVRQVPLWFKDLDEQAFLQDLLDLFMENENLDIPHLQRHVLATMACHSSIRFHHPLSFQEMKQVIADLLACDQPYHCPHGRPTVITLSDSFLRKEFERG